MMLVRAALKKKANGPVRIQTTGRVNALSSSSIQFNYTHQEILRRAQRHAEHCLKCSEVFLVKCFLPSLHSLYKSKLFFLLHIDLINRPSSTIPFLFRSLKDYHGQKM